MQPHERALEVNRRLADLTGCARPVLLAALMAGLLGCPPVWATVTLSARVVRGGLDLDFGAVAAAEASRTEELELTLTSSGGAPYRVYQELPGSLVNERGDRLPDGALLMQVSRGLSGRRGSGGIVPVTPSAQELFVSDQGGSSDTLLLAYSLQPAGAAVAGSYRGILRFTVESLDTGAITTQTLTVRAAVNSTLKLERAGASPSRIELGAAAPGERSSVAEMELLVLSNAGAPIRVMQELVEPMTSQKGDTLAREALTYSVISGQGNQPWRTIPSGAEVLFSDERGETKSFHVAYAVSVPPDQAAGAYRGTVRLRLASAQLPAAAELSFPVELAVSEVFTMSVKSLDGGGNTLHFDRAASGAEIEERTMVVEIRTNMGQPYQVSAGLDHALVLPSGDALPRNALVWSIPKAAHGTSLISTESPVAIGYAPVFQSDAKGSSDSFPLHYRMAIPRDAREGLYSAQLQFTITTF